MLLQTVYAVFSLSGLAVEKSFQYIKTQKGHHQKKSFLQEYEAFLKLSASEIK